MSRRAVACAWLLVGTAAGAPPGSCAELGCQSGYKDNNSCHCNTECVYFANCCADFMTACGRRSGSCLAYGCDKGYWPWNICQCNDACSEHGNCCDDYFGVCANGHPSSTPGPPERPTERPTEKPAEKPAETGDVGCPDYRNLTMDIRVQGISYGPAPEMVEGNLIPSDDFMSPMAAIQWDSWGRGDLEIIRSLGANSVRLYGNDPSQDHAPFLERAASVGLSVIVGLSDWPYLQMPGNCVETSCNCFKQIYESYKQNLENGFTTDGGNAYRMTLKALIVMNEPELKMGQFGDATSFCRSVVSATDAILEAEKDTGVTRNLVALTATVSFATPFGAPGLGQMKKLHECFMNPSQYPTSYSARNDVRAAYLKRWVNSLNTFNSPTEIKHLLFEPYPEYFWTSDLKIPVLIGEYHNLRRPVKYDLPLMVEYTRRYPFVLGLSFFEFSRRYDKTGPEREKELKYGMYGFDEKCVLGEMPFFCEWWTGSPVTKTYKVQAVFPLGDSAGGGVTIEVGVQKAFGGHPTSRTSGCAGPIKVPLTAAAAAATAALAAGCPLLREPLPDEAPKGSRRTRGDTLLAMAPSLQRWCWIQPLLFCVVLCAALPFVACQPSVRSPARAASPRQPHDIDVEEWGAATLTPPAAAYRCVSTTATASWIPARLRSHELKPEERVMPR